MKLDISGIEFGGVKEDKNYDQSFLTRYVMVSELIKKYRVQQKKHGALHILDLGGYNGMARDMMPKDKITILDVFEDESLEDYIRVDSVGVPREDNSYDVVISTDVMEHIPPSERKRFVEEAIRVSRDLVIIAAPFEYGPLAFEEVVANQLYKGETKQDYIWLQEHRDYGLPERRWMEKLLASRSDVAFASFAHADYRVWSELLSAGYFIANNIAAVDKRLSKKLSHLNELYKRDFAKHDFPQDGYRTYFVISKQAAAVQVVTPRYDAEKAHEFMSEIRLSLGASIAGLTKNLYVAQENLRQHEKKVKDLERMLAEKDRLLQSKRHVLVNKIVNSAYRIPLVKKRANK
ncbi:class I SAM-dependent methyltransferase [Candidatus Saccharibacteria bacterium]|nr:MAG: class I SAM-dependent methyltransferase [Candidatus Saccharibacteria bacterium]